MNIIIVIFGYKCFVHSLQLVVNILMNAVYLDALSEEQTKNPVYPNEMLEEQMKCKQV